LIRAILIDDHELVLRGLQRVLELDPRVQVVGVGGSLADAVSLCDRLRPDAVILDLRLPDSRGAQEIPRLKELLPDGKVVILTGYGAAAREECLRMGADAFLTKELASETIAETVCGLFPGVERPSDNLSGLTTREHEVATLMANGLTNGEIADSLCVSLNTVKTHVANVLRKLEVRDRVSLVRIWTADS